MKKSIFLLAYVLIVSNFCSAQLKPIWDTAVYSGDVLPELLVLENGQYLTITRHNKDRSVANAWKFDADGAVILHDSIDFNFTISACGKCLEEIDSNRIIYAQTLFQSSDTVSVQLVEFDAQLNILKSKKYRFQDSLKSQIWGLHKFSDSLIYITGYVYREVNRFSLLLACFDTAFNLKWEREYKRPGNTVGGYWGFDVEPTSDKGFLLGALNTTFPNSPTIIKGQILKVDSVGILQWSKIINPKKTTHFGTSGVQLGKRTDGKYIYVGEELINSDNSRMRFGIINEMGQTLKDTLLGPTIHDFGTFGFTKTLDGNFVTGGGTLENGMQGHVYKFSEDGDSIWHRFYSYGDPQDGSALYSLKSTADTGLIMAGAFFDTYNNPTNRGLYNWILKVDKHGCDSPGCDDIGLLEKSSANIHLAFYPNPAKDNLNLKWVNSENSRLGILNLEIYNLHGQLMIQKDLESETGVIRKIDVSDLKPGHYLLKLSDDKRVWETEILSIQY